MGVEVHQHLADQEQANQDRPDDVAEDRARAMVDGDEDIDGAYAAFVAGPRSSRGPPLGGEFQIGEEGIQATL